MVDWQCESCVILVRKVKNGRMYVTVNSIEGCLCCIGWVCPFASMTSLNNDFVVSLKTLMWSFFMTEKELCKIILTIDCFNKETLVSFYIHR